MSANYTRQNVSQKCQHTNVVAKACKVAKKSSVQPQCSHQWTKKKWPYYRGGRKAEFHCITHSLSEKVLNKETTINLFYGGVFSLGDLHDLV